MQVSDTHLAADSAAPGGLEGLIDWLTVDPPDVLVHTGDIVLADPDDDADRLAAAAVIARLPQPVRCLPGNHDVGFFGDGADLAARQTRFVETWGADRFVVDIPGWRLVGANSYAFEDTEHAAWVAAAIGGAARCAVFVHQPLAGEHVDDGWAIPPAARQATLAALGSSTVELVASGHRHCALIRRVGDADVDDDVATALPSAVHVWAPSTTFTAATPAPGGDPTVGAREFRFDDDGHWATRVIRCDGGDIDPTRWVEFS